MRKNSTFFHTMKIKNLKISEESHKMLKIYCNNNGLKIHKFIEKLIKENCETKKDIYGEF